MKSFKVITPVVFIILTLFSTAFAGGGKAGDVVGSLETRYRAIKTLTADFTQVSKGLSSMDGTSGGQVWFKKPGMIRWTYTKGVTDEIVGDGRILWFYQPDLNQAFKSAGARPDISTDFLSGMGSIKKSFTSTVKFAKKGLVSIRLEPRETHPQIKTLTLIVKEKTLLVTKFILTDHYGNVTEVSFSHIKVNVPVKDDIFAFTPPDGTDIITR